jgi:hypothetical protein
LNKDFDIFVGKPAAFRSEGDKVIPMTSEGQERYEACAARGHKEDVFQVELITRAKAQVDITNSDGAGVETEHLSSVYQLSDLYIVTEAAVIVWCCRV